ncbi:hypothetical protein AKJ40_03000 [candidate division MSBL1 archaeon SCGC-AAA259M10]|uniref:Glycosyl transferase family 1 n=1 Tax=candidate division MSBL1 archaeon SCGC-AAA259M10 TaxID=1698270 RepID=A0A133UZ79_9EURY|nr:hypothetical protein AKJ40_03000 [candidate division MSBL1 archaeon SCGC-AAA259M10]
MTDLPRDLNRRFLGDIHSALEGASKERVKSVGLPLLSQSSVLPPNPAHLRELLRDGGFDIIHAHHAFTPTPLFSILLANELETPTVLTNHSVSFAYDYSPFWQPLAKFLYPYKELINSVDRVIAVSEAAAIFIGHFVSGEKISVIPNPVHEDYFETGETDSRNRTSRGKTVLYVGRLSREKGVHKLPSILKTVSEEFSDVQLIIAGSGYLSKFIDLTAKLKGIRNKVRMLGKVSREGSLPSLYERADAVVVPSLREAFSITLLEAMASGCPVVASRVGGMKEIIKDGHSGVLVGGKASDFADALLRVLSDPSLSKELGWNARKVASKCRPRKIAEQVEEVYRDVAASRNTSP